MKVFNLSIFEPGRFRFVWLLAAVLFLVSFLTRTVLLIYSGSLVEMSFKNIAGIFVIGLLYDLVNASYFILPGLIYLWIIPRRIFRTSIHRIVTLIAFFLYTFILLFTALAEYFFWDEFGTRFNFIAVDYLVYTTEVIGNIRQSYPMEMIGIVLFLATFLITYLFRNYLSGSPSGPVFKTRTAYIATGLVIPFFGFFLVDNQLRNLYV